MKAVSLYDSMIVAIRESRFSREEAAEIINEFRAVYPEVFEQSGLDSGNFPADFNERMQGDVSYRGHMRSPNAESDDEDLG